MTEQESSRIMISAYEIAISALEKTIVVLQEDAQTTGFLNERICALNYAINILKGLIEVHREDL